MDKREENRKFDKSRGQYRLALALLDNIPDLKGKKILDLGAGMGEFSQILKFQGCGVFCLDSADKCYQALLAGGFRSYRADLENEKLPFSDKEFDVVISLEVIEHIWNTDNYLREISRVLKPAGRAVFTTPNYNHWRFRFLSLIGMFEKFTYKSRHKKFYTAKSFPLEIEKYFTVKQMLGRGWLPKLGLDFINKRFINFFSVHIGLLAEKPNELSLKTNI